MDLERNMAKKAKKAKKATRTKRPRQSIDVKTVRRELEKRITKLKSALESGQTAEKGRKRLANMRKAMKFLSADCPNDMNVDFG